MKNESSVESLDGLDGLDNLTRAIRANAQQDVDAEIPPGDTTARVSKAGDNEFTQKIGAAAQSFIAASPNSLGPPINPSAAYLKMTKCGQYGPGNSTLWKSPFLPKLDNEDGRHGLMDHQVTGIVWLLSRMFGSLPTLRYRDPSTNVYHLSVGTSSDAKLLRGPKYFGGILADSMGLGKTLITVALVNLLMSQRLNILKAEDGTSKHRPILLLTPNATVANQWVEEFTKVIDEVQIIVSGQGLESASRPRVISLDRDNFKQWPAIIGYVWDENDPRASKIVIIMTTESWAHRTCVGEKEKGWSSTFTQEGRRFSLVIVDEAYKVKNPNTKNWRSVYLLEREFTLLITATPCMNTLTDILGLARLLWTKPEKYLKQNPEMWKDIEMKFPGLEHLDMLDTLKPWDPYRLVAGRPSLLARLLCKRKGSRMHSVDLTRKYLRHFESLAMLKRSPSSYIYFDWDKANPISLEGLFPKVENYTVDISPGEAHAQKYQSEHIDLLIRYLEQLQTWGGVVNRRLRKQEIKKEEEDTKEHIMSFHRLFQIASSSLDVYDLHKIITDNGHSSLSPKVAEMRESEVNLLRLAQFLVPLTDTKPNTHVGWMELATRNSPILRYILHYILENILAMGENGKIRKLLIIEQNPMVAFYYELVLQFLGFECRCMHAQLSFDERQALVDSFNSSDDSSCQILIQMYTVGFAGTNLHKSCSRVLVASQSHSLQVQWQAIYRVIRVGQNSDVTVHRLILKNSYHSFRESRQIEKILPELGARVQGKTKQVLVRLLNLFQHEIHEAWNSREGQKLLRERNLLGDNEIQEEEERIIKKTKLNLPVKFFKNPKSNPGINAEAKVENQKIRIKVEEGRSSGNPIVSTEPPATGVSNLKKRKLDDIKPRTGDGDGGWFSNGKLNDHEEFLALRTRDDYYREFIELPSQAMRAFSHAKNNLRRLLSFGNDAGKLSTEPWTEIDLENPAVLERALELMLRVRLGAKDVAMLPFPTIELSAAPASRQEHLQSLLGKTRLTERELVSATPTASKDLRETLQGSDLNKPLAEIDRDLEEHARFGDASPRSVKKTTTEGQAGKKMMDISDDDDEMEVVKGEVDSELEDMAEFKLKGIPEFRP
ncbi:P-loop containing nucleoside triphosphate hydrolase protein [Xylaria digitata]|nr:P-loop containing nucleoside triphosphate hydrolase protein [Xylaria digitata]